MKKILMKTRMFAVICAGMVLFTGCGSADTETEITDMQDAGIIEDAIAADQNELSKELEVDTGSDRETEAGEGDREKNEAALDTFTDGNDMISSADVSGTASGCSDKGCIINTSPFADSSAPSSSADGGNMEIIYTDETVFQKGIVKSDGSSSYSLEDSEKSVLKDSDFVLCFGTKQEDGVYLADRIIVVEFN